MNQWDLGPPDHDEHETLEDEDDDDRVLVDSVQVSCPYCGRGVEHLVDPAGGAHQVYVEDCEVCCQPWQVTVHVTEGVVWADVSALDE
jgi:hypothetical protein